MAPRTPRDFKEALGPRSPHQAPAALEKEKEAAVPPPLAEPVPLAAARPMRRSLKPHQVRSSRRSLGELEAVRPLTRAAPSTGPTTEKPEEPKKQQQPPAAVGSPADGGPMMRVLDDTHPILRRVFGEDSVLFCTPGSDVPFIMTTHEPEWATQMGGQLMWKELGAEEQQPADAATPRIDRPFILITPEDAESLQLAPPADRPTAQQEQGAVGAGTGTNGPAGSNGAPASPAGSNAASGRKEFVRLAQKLAKHKSLASVGGSRQNKPAAARPLPRSKSAAFVQAADFEDATSACRELFAQTGRAEYLMLEDRFEKRPTRAIDYYKRTPRYLDHPLNVQANKVNQILIDMLAHECRAAGCQQPAVIPYDFCGGRHLCKTTNSDIKRADSELSDAAAVTVEEGGDDEEAPVSIATLLQHRRKPSQRVNTLTELLELKGQGVPERAADSDGPGVVAGGQATLLDMARRAVQMDAKAEADLHRRATRMLAEGPESALADDDTDDDDPDDDDDDDYDYDTDGSDVAP